MAQLNLLAKGPPYPDPGHYGQPSSWDNDTKFSLLTTTWQTVKDYSFPPRTICGKERRFTANWICDYPWLRYSELKDGVYCAPCLLFGGQRKGKKSQFTTRPVNDWKNISMYVNRHGKEESHSTSSIMADNFIDVITGKRESINTQLSANAKETVVTNRHILREIIETLVLFGKQNIAVRGHTEEKSNFIAILQSKAKHDNILAAHLQNAQRHAKYTSPDIQNEIIELCAEHVRDTLIADCKQSLFFAVMADEATDCSTKEQLSLCVRFVSKVGESHEVREEFLGFVTCRSIKGSNLAELILENLKDLGIDVQTMRAQCYDGAGNMSGKHKGVQAVIKREVPLANYVHCKSHSLNLALVHSSKLQCVRTMMATVQDVAFAFDYSAKRLLAFRDELSSDNVANEALDGRTKLKTLCETRWASRADSLTTFKAAFPVVVHALETLHEDGDVKAGLHLTAVLQFPFIIALVSTQHILSNLVGLTAILQKTDMDLLEAVRETDVVLEVYRQERQDDLVWTALFDEACDIASQFQIQPSVPRQAASQKNRANYAIGEPREYWKVALYNVFLDHLMQELDARILQNEGRYSAQMLLPSRVSQMQSEQVDAIYSTYAPDLTASKQEFAGEVRRWSTRWAMTESRPGKLIESLDKVNPEAYPSIHTIFRVLLTMPATSASCERSFSSMRRIKTYLRSTMTGERLSALGLLHVHRDIGIDIEQIINKFGSAKCRNLEFF